MRSLLNFRIAVWFLSVSYLGAGLMTAIPAIAALLPERVEKAAQASLVRATRLRKRSAVQSSPAGRHGTNGANNTPTC